MDFSSISSSYGSSSLDPAGASFQKRKNDAMALEKALKSGDLDAAKKAFETFKKNVPKPPSASDQEKTPLGTNPALDIKAVGEALKAGDIEAAQKAFKAFKHDVREARFRQHHQNSEVASQSSAIEGSSFNGTLNNEGTIVGSNLSVIA